MSSAARPNWRPARFLMYTAYFDPEYSGAALQALTLARNCGSAATTSSSSPTAGLV